MSKTNRNRQQQFRTEKITRYGIRKYSFGAASVAIATGLLFLGNGAVYAEQESNISAAGPLEQVTDMTTTSLE